MPLAFCLFWQFRASSFNAGSASRIGCGVFSPLSLSLSLSLPLSLSLSLSPSPPPPPSLPPSLSLSLSLPPSLPPSLSLSWEFPVFLFLCVFRSLYPRQSRAAPPSHSCRIILSDRESATLPVKGKNKWWAKTGAERGLMKMECWPSVSLLWYCEAGLGAEMMPAVWDLEDSCLSRLIVYLADSLCLRCVPIPVITSPVWFVS